MIAALATLPLLPMDRVLFPGQRLVLRTSDASNMHYRDLVRECGRLGTGIGICLMLAGEKQGQSDAPAAFGTEAKIEDFHLENGALDLHVRGARRFRVARTRVRDNGLLLGDVEFKPEPAPKPLPPQYAILGELLRVMGDIKNNPISELAHASKQEWEDACWISWRFCSVLPMSETRRQTFLEENDVDARLQKLLERMDEIGKNEATPSAG